jgi:3-keto-disaccharide hydrolase
MLEEKTGGANTQKGHPRRMRHIIFLVIIVMLLLLSISSFFFIITGRGNGSRLATNTEIPTPTSTPTSIYLETPPAQSEFYDTFKNNALGWSVSSTAGYYRTVKPGALTLVNTNLDTTMVESLPTNSTFDNCTVIVNLTILKANLDDSVGIYVRGDSNLERDYRIDLNGNGTFDIAKEYLDASNNPQSAILLGPKTDPALNPQGESNTITLTMYGSQLQLFINNVKVGDVIDSDYISGQVALFTHLGGSSQDVAASFSMVEIDKISGTLTGTG